MKTRIALVLIALTLGTWAAAGPTPDQALVLLQKGNARFVSGHPAQHAHRDQLAELTQGQAPYAAVLCCADSRVPPELIFDETLGRLFIVRVAGNVASPVELGSIEYAVAHLHSPLVVVLGHEACGAVDATLHAKEAPPNIQAIVDLIKPAAPAGTKLSDAIKANVLLQTQAVETDAIVAKALSGHQVKVAAALYHLHDGRVEWLPVPVPAAKP